MGGYNSYGVYQSTNGGSSWTNISSGLPAIPVMCVIQNKQNTAQNELYAGTDVGVYVKVGTANWAPFYTNLPNVVVTELDIYYNATPTNSRLRAATYGRGLWESDLYTIAAAPVTDFSANDVTPLVGQTVTFTDLSSNAPTWWTWSFSPPTVSYVGGTNSSSQNPQVQFTNNGIYTVSLTTGNGVGSDNETKTSYIYAGTPGLWTGITTQDWNTASNWHNYLVPASIQDVTIPAAPYTWPIYTGNLTLGTICRDILMDAASEMIILGDLTIPSGRTLTCNANSKIYVEGDWTNNGNFVEGVGTVEFIGTSSSSITGGKVEKFGYGGKLDNSGGGGNYTSNRFLYLDAYEPFTIKTVKVYASGAGNRTILLRNSGGTVLEQTTINIPDGEQTITLNFDVPVGNDMELAIASSSTTSLYRNNSGVSYPYNIGDVGAITGSSASSSGYYYFFYNIEYYVEGEPETFNNLNISKSINPVTTNGNINVVNDLTVAPGAYFTIDNENLVEVAGDLLLDANSTVKASLIDNGILTVGGTTSVKSHYVDNRWHFISSPVSNAVSNIFLGIYLKDWNEADSSWTYITPTNHPLSVGEGFEIWSTLGNPVVNYTGGNLNTGNISPQVMATDQGGTPGIGVDEGWNFVGNPYPSAIDLGAPGNVLPSYTWTNLDYTVYLWNGAQYASYNPFTGASINSGTRYVPSMQSFFVKASNFSPALIIPNSARLHTSQSNYKYTWEDQLMKLHVEGNGYSDETLILTYEQATKNFDSKYDAHKMWGIDDAPQLYTVALGEKYGVNVLPDISTDDVIPVGLKVGVENEYVVSLDQIEQYDNYEGVWFVDLKTGVIVNLLESSSYSFISEPGDDEQRFMIHFKYPQIHNSNNSDISIYSYDDRIFIKTYNSPIEKLAVYDMLGQKLINEENMNIEETEIQITSGMGYYLVKVYTNTSSKTEKVFIR